MTYLCYTFALWGVWVGIWMGKTMERRAMKER